MASASVSGLLCSSISSSSIAFNEGFPKQTKAHLTPSFLQDLKDCEHCDVDQLLLVFLEHCRATDSTDPLTPRIPQSEGNSQSSEAAPDATTAPNRSQKGAVDITPTTHELLEVCLKKTITVCNDPKMKASIKHYQESHNETHYRPFVELANRALELVKPLEIRGLREASTSDILFDVNSNNAITTKGKVARFSDIVVVPLASAQRVRGTTGSWDECTGQSLSRGSFDWPDVLLSAEMKWFHSTLGYQQPEAYGTDLKLIYRPIPTHDDASKFASILSGEPVSNSNTSPGPSVLPSLGLAGSGPTHDSAFLAGYQRDGVEASRTVEMSERLGPRGHKRSTSDHLVQQTTKKPTLDKDSLNHVTKKCMLEAVKQSAINAAEMLRCSLGRRHALGMISIDEIVWVWWFDRQGAIQSTGINIIEDLPRFLVLLFAFQRFTLADWGFDVELDPSIQPRHNTGASLTSQPVQLEFDREDGKFKIEFTFGPDIVLHNAFNLRGKSTIVFRVTSHMDNNNSGLVAKLYWPNQDRAHEADIIKRACKDPEVANHLPYVFGSRDLDPVGTRRIRQELGIDIKSPRSPRLPRIILFEELHPITKLSGNQFVFAWLECIRCHYRAWENSIRHLDLSLRNLMLRPRNEPGHPEFFGVVNDWDLSDNDEKNLLESRKDLTKTLLFTSLDLLAKRDEQVIQQYSHDLESFVWILIWVFLAVEEGEIKPIAEVVGWRTSHPDTSFNERNAFFSNIHKYEPHGEWRPYWRMAWDIAGWLQSRNPNPLADPDVYFGEVKSEEKEEETPEERKKSLRTLLEIVKKRYEGNMPSLPQIPGL